MFNILGGGGGGGGGRRGRATLDTLPYSLV